MTSMTTNATRIAADRLAAFIVRALAAAGLPAADAETVAGLMVEADLRGSDTHGVIRLPLYVRRIRAGGVNAKPGDLDAAAAGPAQCVRGQPQVRLPERVGTGDRCGLERRFAAW